MQNIDRKSYCKYLGIPLTILIFLTSCSDEPENNCDICIASCDANTVFIEQFNQCVESNCPECR